MLDKKCLIDFNDWYNIYSEKNHKLDGWRDNDLYIDEVTLPCEAFNAIVTNFFDTNDIIIEVNRIDDDLNIWSFTIKSQGLEYYGDNSNNRINSNKLAIIKCNEIYNMLYN